MIKFEMKTYNTILIEKHKKYQYYHQAKFINTNVLQVKRRKPNNQITK